MATMDMAELALKCVAPTNKFLYDDEGAGTIPSVFVYIPKFRLCDVLSTTDTSVHPAFRVNGKEIDGFYYAKFASKNYDGKAYSIPGEDPSAYTTLDNVVAYNRAKGGKFHEVTAAEDAAVALWCHKNGTEPKGNNDYGKDISETLRQAIPMAKDSSGKTMRVASGSGPVTWSHDGTRAGIWDLNGNIWRWCTGFRLVYGEVQIIEDNNAADPTCDLKATSAAWRAINASTGELVEPDGAGTTQGTVKLDYISGVWTYSTTIAHTKVANGCSFKSVVADGSIGDKAKLLLQALAMLPDTALTGDGIDANYGGDYFFANNTEAERCLRRGGGWDNPGNAGVFCSSLYDPRSRSHDSIGGRSASL